MPFPRRRLRHSLVAAACFFFVPKLAADAAPVAFKSAEATHQDANGGDIAGAIDGLPASPEGWRLGSPMESPQSIIFRAAAPIEAGTVELTLFFLSGWPNGAIAEFALAATSDAEPTLAGNWTPLEIVDFSATNATLARTETGRLRAAETPDGQDGVRKDATYKVAVRTASGAVTGFRLTAYPVRRADRPEGALMSWGYEGVFILTEFRATPIARTSTNIALGCPVKATHPLHGAMLPGALTDGLPSTLAHPMDEHLGSAFHFEIDLGSVRGLDHIGLRNRGESLSINRLSRVLLQLYREDPAGGAQPVWEAMNRADGSHPGVGKVDVVRASDGRGEFRGRYLRLSSDSPVGLSPQFAEVEVYETLTPQIAAVRGDGRELGRAAPRIVPPGTQRLSVAIKLPQFGLPADLPFRWRMRGSLEPWQNASGLTVEMPVPPAGAYTFEAQLGHTDQIWDATLLTLPMRIEARLWETTAFRWSAAAGALVLVALVAWNITRRRMARQFAKVEAAAALAGERARIARDMHDEVGARLAQLAVLQDVFGREHTLPESAQESLRHLSVTARQAVASLDEVVWTVNPRNDTLPSLAEYLAQCATSYLAPLDIACRLDAQIDWPRIEIRAQTRHDLVLAFKEALQNVVKHSGATQVTLTLRHEPPHFILRLADNGRGLPDHPGGPGKDGIENMKARLADIGGTCQITRRPQGGTEVEMRVRLPA